MSKTKGKKKDQGARTLPSQESTHKASVKDATGAKKGKKRARNGDVRTSQAESRPPKHSGVNDGAGKKDYEEEVYALGGTEEDLELIASLESGSELDGDLKQSRSKSSVNEKSLKNGISKMAKNLKGSEDLSDAHLDSDETESLPDITMHTSLKPAKSAAPPLAKDNRAPKERSIPMKKGNLVSALQQCRFQLLIITDPRPSS